MSDLNEKKLEEEILLLKIQRKAAKVRLYFDILKAVVVFSGAIVVFWFIQQPESLLNRASSKEAISRERAKLMLDCIKESDPQKQGNALAVIRAAYGESDNEWIQKVELRLESGAKAVAVNQLLQQHEKLVIKSQELKEEMLKEETGFSQGPQGPQGPAGTPGPTGPWSGGGGGGGSPGRGPRWTVLRNDLASSEFEIKNILKQLASYGFDVTKIDQK